MKFHPRAIVSKNGDAPIFSDMTLGQYLFVLMAVAGGFALVMAVLALAMAVLVQIALAVLQAALKS